MYGVADLTGTWAVTRREKPVNAAICDKHTDKRGLPRNPCRFNADLLKLTQRAYAWLDFHDEKIEGKYYCVPESIPSLLVRDYPVRIEQRVGRVTFEHQITIHNNATRVVYTDRRSHLDPGDIPLYYGYSVGKYEGDDFVVDTRNFVFDPNGIDYMTNIPSSWRKKGHRALYQNCSGQAAVGADARGPRVHAGAVYRDAGTVEDGLRNHLDALRRRKRARRHQHD